VITGLLIYGPVEKLANHIGELGARLFGFSAVTVVDVTG